MLFGCRRKCNPSRRRKSGRFSTGLPLLVAIPDFDASTKIPSSFEDTLSDFKAGKKLPLHIHPDTAGPKPLPVLGIRRIRARKVNSQAAADADYKASLAKGYEGQIVQSPDGTVEKRKPMKDAEFRITGKARGKAHGILTVATADKQPFRVQVHPDKISEPGIIGKHATIAFPRKSKRGIPQQPVFKSVRDYSALMPGMIQVGSLT